MAKQKIETVRELIYLSYANLAMAHTAVDKKQEKYEPFNFPNWATKYFVDSLVLEKECLKETL